MKKNNLCIGKRAIEIVKKYEKKCGRTIIDVQYNKNFKGFDLISISKNKKSIRTIEVKGTKDKYGIPDLYESEVTRNKKLIANYLYVVSFFSKKPKLYVIPSQVISPEDLRIATYFKVCSNFKTKRMKKYLVN